MSDPVNPEVTPDDTAAPAPAPEEGSPDFLSMVRNLNASRSDSPPPEEAPEEPEVVEPGDQEDVDVKAAGDEEESDDSITIDPLTSAPPKKEKKSKEDNIKGLRNALKTEREKIDTLETELKQTKDKLEHVGDVEELRGQLEEARKEVEQLKKYESLVGLKQSKEYKERYIDGVDNLVKQAQEIAKDYEVPNEVLQQLVSTGNRRDMNRLLAEHFDTIGAGDIRPVILDIQKLLIEKKKVENDPSKAEKDLLEAAKTKEKKEQELARRDLESVVQSGWADIATLYSGKDSAVEPLKEVSGNESHNKTRTEIMQRAAKDYGQVMGILVKHGLRKLPEETAKAFAARFQLAEVTGHLMAQNETLLEQNKELRTKLGKYSNYTRPLSSGNSVQRGSSGDSPKDIPAKDIAATVFASAAEKLDAQ